MSISVAIPYYNNSRFMNETLEYIVTDSRITEIVITDDKSREEEIKKLEEIIKEYSQIKLFKNNKNLGVFLNKLEALTKCKNDWMILCDSDNIIGKEYVDAIYKEKWDRTFIYAPDWAKTFPGNPSTMLNYKWLDNQVIDYKKALALRSNAKFLCFINTCNFFCNKKLLKFMDRKSFYRPEMSCIDSFYINKCWLKGKNKIKIVKGMEYKHRLHGRSNYMKTKNSREAFHRNRFFIELQKVV